jgi:transposase
MNVKTVERLYYQQAEAVIDLPQRYAQVRKLGIDEISLRKGKGEYCCVLTDLERGRQLDILPDRKKETLIAHFQSLGSSFCEQIKHVSCDMWGPYSGVAKQCFPQAKVTIDRFHVVKALNDVLDTIRKTLRRAYPQQTAFKKLKWILFKRSKTLSDEQQLALQKAFALSKELQQAYQLRNSFHDIFDQTQSKPEAQQRLEGWVQKVNCTQNPAWNKFLKTLTNWKDPILNFVESGISNAVTEGCNNLVRYVRRVSFGIPNFEHMRLRVLVNST